jgi:hypothetical protein
MDELLNDVLASTRLDSYTFFVMCSPCASRLDDSLRLISPAVRRFALGAARCVTYSYSMLPRHADMQCFSITPTVPATS